MADFIPIGSSSEEVEFVAVSVQPQTTKTKITVSVTHGPTVNNAHLREAFLKYKAKKCKVIYTTGSKKAGYALVQFSRESDALKAIQEMDGIVINNESISCRLATPEEIEKLKTKKKKRKLSETPSADHQVLKPLNDNNESKEQYKPYFDILDRGVNSHDALCHQELFAIDFESALAMKGGYHFPCEISIVKFTLYDGIIDNYHCFIDPGSIPVSQHGQASFVMTRVTGIPFTNFRLAKNNYKVIWNDVKKFLSTSTDPLLFAKGKPVDVYCLNWIATKAGETNSFVIREIEDFIELVYVLHLQSAKNVDNNNVDGVSLDSFKPDVSRYLQSMSNHYEEKCDYHESLEGRVSYHCALGDVRSIANTVRRIYKEVFKNSAMIKVEKDKKHNWTVFMPNNTTNNQEEDIHESQRNQEPEDWNNDRPWW